ncbi:hypothetical protein BJ912DRAFT_1021255 [Pholiota molesta]|nr:hypothetical protein BJ912DRAFT_1021255 [Pholiota molesta]
MLFFDHSIGLAPHPLARERCVAKSHFKPGSHILSAPAYAAILLDSEKGRRCDLCFRLPSDGVPLKRCQSIHWKAQHRRICKTYNSFLLSPEYQALPHHQKLDAILLSHAVARLSLLSNSYVLQSDVPSALVMSLLPYPNEFIPPPPICPIMPPPPAELVQKLYARFGNNNFAIHSHLTTIGHGIFPHASRLFNHSCLPNAAAKYILSPNNSVAMGIISLTYLDPALLESREQILEISYGFKCQCAPSLFLRNIGQLPEAPSTEGELSHVSRELCKFVGFEFTMNNLPMKSIESMPPSLYCVLRESYMAEISEIFSRTSHEGQYDIALESGITLLSLYILIYPINYPQIGMHLLEMAKTAWNAVITSADESNEGPLKEQARRFLLLTNQVMTVFGSEGDDGGPIQELATLNKLLESDNV